MSIKCPKCSFINTLEFEEFKNECPKCKIVYTKFKQEIVIENMKTKTKTDSTSDLTELYEDKLSKTEYIKKVNKYFILGSSTIISGSFFLITFVMS